MNRYQDAFEKHGTAVAAKLKLDLTDRQAFQIAENAAETPELARIYAEARTKGGPAALFAAFAHMTDPTAARTNRPWKYLDWICDRYLHNPGFVGGIFAEDLYKVRDDLAYLDAAGGRLKPEQRSIAHYDSLEALRETLRPFIQERDRRKAARQERRMEDEARQKIMNETSVIYDGPEGKIVVPHSMESCIYWGQQTQWCISAEKAQNFFRSYNEKDPIWIYLTKPKQEEKNAYTRSSSHKFAGTGGNLYDEHDSRPEILPPHLDRLIRAALKNVSPRLGKHLKKRGGFAKLKPAIPCDPARWSEPQTLLDAIRQDSRYAYFIPPGLAADAGFMLGVIKAQNNTLKFAAPPLLADRTFMLGALQAGCTAAIKNLPEGCREDPEIILAALGAMYKSPGNGNFDFVVPELFKNRDFMKRAVGVNGRIYLEADEELRSDREIALTALAGPAGSHDIRFFNLPPHLLKDKDIALAAFRNHPYSADEDTSFLWETDEMLAEAIKINGDVLNYVPLARITKELVLAAMSNENYRLHPRTSNPRLPPGLLDDADIMMAWLKSDVRALQAASPRLQKDKGFILSAVGAKPEALEYVLSRFRDDQDIVMAAVTKKGEMLEHASHRLKADRNVVLAAETATAGACAYAVLDLRLDRSLKLRAGLKRVWNRAAGGCADAAKAGLRAAWNGTAAKIPSFAAPRLPRPER